MTSQFTFTFVRHGQTDANQEGRFIGILDQPLNAIGQHQAQLTAQYLKDSCLNFDIILTSPLKRCIETAEIIHQKISIPVEIETALRERNYGVFEGLTISEAETRYPEIYREYKKNKPFVALPEGETAYNVEARVKDFLEHRLPSLSTRPQILLVTHLNPIRAFLHLLRLVDWEIYFRPFKNASITKIETDLHTSRIVQIDQVIGMNEVEQKVVNPYC
jgi:broad specificity phosphatase PhoE